MQFKRISPLAGSRISPLGAGVRIRGLNDCQRGENDFSKRPPPVVKSFSYRKRTFSNSALSVEKWLFTTSEWATTLPPTLRGATPPCRLIPTQKPKGAKNRPSGFSHPAHPQSDAPQDTSAVAGGYAPPRSFAARLPLGRSAPSERKACGLPQTSRSSLKAQAPKQGSSKSVRVAQAQPKARSSK